MSTQRPKRCSIGLQHARAYEKQPYEDYPIANEHIIVGICFGELSASAVTLARSLVELIPIAVEAVRLAFRCGILSSLVGNGLEKRSLPALPWSTVLASETNLADESTLERIAVEAVSSSSNCLCSCD